MVKSGSFKVSQGSTAGRFGSGLGQGLGEALPKEIAQQRLSSGLKNFAQNAGNLSPLQAATQLFSIPGVTPQMVQVLPELLKRQQYAQAMSQQQQNHTQEQPQNQFNAGQIGAEGTLTKNPPIVKPSDQGQPQAVTQSPFREEVTSRPNWTQERFNQERANVAGEMPWLTIPEINDEVRQREARYQAAPEAYKKN